jgi:VanZ family protein
MSYSRLSDRRRVPWPRSWHLVAGGAIIAVLLQLWGLYRVAGPPQPPWFPFADKVEHAVGFALPVLLILLAIASRGAVSWQWPNMRTGVLLVVAIFAAHGVVSELVQHQWYRYRTGDPLDVLADWVGIAVGMLLIRLILLRRSHAVESLATL